MLSILGGKKHVLLDQKSDSFHIVLVRKAIALLGGTSLLLSNLPWLLVPLTTALDEQPRQLKQQIKNYSLNLK